MPWWWSFEKPWIEPVDESIEESIDDEEEIVEDVPQLLDDDVPMEDSRNVDVDEYGQQFDGDDWSDEHGRIHNTGPRLNKPRNPCEDELIDDNPDQDLDDYEGLFDGYGHSDLEGTDLLDYEEYEGAGEVQPSPNRRSPRRSQPPVEGVPDDDLPNATPSPRRTRWSSAAQRARSPAYSPQAPVYPARPSTPRYSPASPWCRPTSAQHNPTSPEYIPRSPPSVHPSRSPRGTPTSSQYYPTSSRYSPIPSQVDSNLSGAEYDLYGDRLPTSPRYSPVLPSTHGPNISGAEHDLRGDRLPGWPGEDSGEGFISPPRRYPLRRPLSSQLRDDFPSPPSESLEVDSQVRSAQAPNEIDDDFESSSDADSSDIEVVNLTGAGMHDPAPESNEAVAEDVPAVVNFGLLERPSANRNALIGLSFGPQLDNLVRRGYAPAEAFAFVGGLFDRHVDAYGAYDATTGRYRDFRTPQMTTLYHFLCGEILAVGRNRHAFQHQQDEARAQVHQILVNSGHPHATTLAFFYNRWMLRGFDSYAIYDMIRYHEDNHARAQVAVEDLNWMDTNLAMDDPTHLLENAAPSAYNAMAESWENVRAGQPGYGSTYLSPATLPLRGVYQRQSMPPTVQSWYTAQQAQEEVTSPSVRSSQTFGRASPALPTARPFRQGPPTYPIPGPFTRHRSVPSGSSSPSNSSHHPAPGPSSTRNPPPPPEQSARQRGGLSGDSSPSGGSTPASSYHPPAHSSSTIGPQTPEARAFDEFMNRNRPRSSAKRTFKDYRVKKVDPLRYQNRLSEPRRLPNTPTKSHLPPSPRRRGRKPTKCDACDRAFRPRKKATAAAGRKSERVRKGVERLGI